MIGSSSAIEIETTNENSVHTDWYAVYYHRNENSALIGRPYIFTEMKNLHWLVGVYYHRNENSALIGRPYIITEMKNNIDIASIILVSIFILSSFLLKQTTFWLDVNLYLFL